MGGGVNDLMGGGVKRREKERDPTLRKISMWKETLQLS